MAVGKEGSMGNGLIAGFVATLMLSALMLMKSAIGLMPQLDVIGMLGGMLGSGAVLAWLVHFIVGTVGYGIAMALLSPKTQSGDLATGLMLGAAGWLIMMIMLMPMAGNGLFGITLGIMVPVMTLILHLIFGAVLGWTFRRLQARRKDVAHRA